MPADERSTRTSAAAMLGVSQNVFAPYRITGSQNLKSPAPSGGGTRTTEAPHIRGQRSVFRNPAMYDIGNRCKKRCDSSNPCSSLNATAFRRRFSARWTTALGKPVVPDVKVIENTSAG